MKNKEKIMVAMEKDFVVIGVAEFRSLNVVEGVEIDVYGGGKSGFETLYFKPKDSFPLIYEDESRKIEVDSDGGLSIYGCHNLKDCINYYSSLDILEDAMAMSKKLRGKK